MVLVVLLLVPLIAYIISVNCDISASVPPSRVSSPPLWVALTCSLLLLRGLASLELEHVKDGDLTKLHPFEVAQLANLIQGEGVSVEEALAWLPSLDRFEEASLQQALDVVSRARSRMS